jgi:hypothetical protein
MKKEIPFAVGVGILVVVALFAFEIISHQSNVATTTTSTNQSSSSIISLPTDYVNVYYDTNLGIKSDTEAVTTSGQLPGGLSISPVFPPCPMNPHTGQMVSCGVYFILQGTSTQAGAYSFSVMFSSNGEQSTQSFDIQVLPQSQPAPSVPPLPPPPPLP